MQVLCGVHLRGCLDLFLHLTIATIATQTFFIIKMSIHFTFQNYIQYTFQ